MKKRYAIFTSASSKVLFSLDVEFNIIEEKEIGIIRDVVKSNSKVDMNLEGWNDRIAVYYNESHNNQPIYPRIDEDKIFFGRDVTLYPSIMFWYSGIFSADKKPNIHLLDEEATEDQAILMYECL